MARKNGEPRQIRKQNSNSLGEVIAASVSGEIIIKMRGASESLRIGYPVITEGRKFEFFSIVSDVETPLNDTAIMFANVDEYRNASEMFLFKDRTTASRGKKFFSIAKLNCVKMVSKEDYQLLEYETVPEHFAETRMATLKDIELVYKQKESSRSVGSLRGLPEFPIPIDFEKLTAVPFGIFGRTNSGKTFLNKIILGNILHSNVAQVLVFDTQSEYGWQSRADQSPGLKHFFEEKIKIFTLDPQQNSQADETLIIDSTEIYPEDILISFRDLSENMINAVYSINRHRNSLSLLEAIEQTTDEILPDGIDHTIHPATLDGLKRRIERFQNFAFIQRHSGKGLLNRLLELIKNQYSIVIDFGRYGTDFATYLLVANLVVRRLYYAYSSVKNPNELPRLVVLLEEAHKFLDSSIASSTIFDRLAREMRKFGLVLAMVDQRPSSIDDEIISQLANRFILSLTDPNDIMAALTGPVDPRKWKSIVSAMPLRHALIFGDAIPVPTTIEVEEYSEKTMRKKWDINFNLNEYREKLDNLSKDQLDHVFEE